MPTTEINAETKAQVLAMQREELTGYETYKKLATKIKDPHNREVIYKIANDEQGHYQTLKRYSGEDVSPNNLKITFFYWLSRILGLTFGIKLMERGEEDAQAAYTKIRESIPEIEKILEDEEEHEQLLLGMLDEEGLKYAGSVVLGLNDALVELTGALAGLTFAFQNTNIIALAGLITGISASFSMAASEYLSTKSGEEDLDPIKSAVYTGLAYIFTVIVLILPYLIFSNYLVCLGFTILNAILVIALFNFYIAVAKDLEFKKRFFEMAGISLGVAALSFVIGNIIRGVFGIDI
ncbi:MAG: VIT1/CCC1 transporter family protein [Anaerolineae bacterium]|nr:VIT1/CCC1 transporter family protein [Anaerolineae bacterium]